ncbi:MAG: 16S rRNA (guanine(527)-N(7))-methyltransferase RsmG [Gammaproteobacteria bacterium]|nr:16S rRNA (guanine(527)-N(7))-methyltransferase RsmG [Gammaproteobacteria bacterium]
MVARLAAGLAELQIPLSPHAMEQLCDYLTELERWNRRINLTAVRSPLEMVQRHLLDSLAIAPLLQGQRLIDVGSGAGLPGIPLAIYAEEIAPDWQITLLDSRSKRCHFLNQVKGRLGLTAVNVIHCRSEAHRPTERYDAVLTRAFASLEAMVSQTAHLLRPQGHFYAMKGAVSDSELAQLKARDDVATIAIHPLEVPGLAHEPRHLLSMTLK